MTHARTSHPESSGPRGLVSQLSEHLRRLGTSTTVVISEENRHSEALVPLKRSEVLASINAELALEEEWRRLTGPRQLTAALSALMWARRLYRRARLAPPWRRRPAATPAGAAMLRRLANIELAHLALLEQASESGADWVLIVEDDAHLEDPSDFASSLVQFMDRRANSPQPSYVNVSRSFSHEKLADTGHLAPEGPWSHSVAILSSDFPLTNTVCAVLYRGSFLETLLPVLTEIPISPVVPIDWKLNKALLALYQGDRYRSGDCWFLEPAPIVQGSMHSQKGIE